MAVELKTMRCPSCGARLKVDPHSKFAECPACETQVNIYNEAEEFDRMVAGKASGRERDTVLFPFEITEEEYRINFINWLDQDIFPFEVYDMVEIKSSRGYYVPFYLYRGDDLMLPVCASDKIDALCGKYGECMVEGIRGVVEKMTEAGGYEEYTPPEDNYEILNFDYTSERCFSHKTRKLLTELEYSSAWEADTSTPAYFSIWITEFTIMDNEYVHISSGAIYDSYWASVPLINKEGSVDPYDFLNYDNPLRDELGSWLKSKGYAVAAPIKQKNCDAWESSFETEQKMRYETKNDVIANFKKFYIKKTVAIKDKEGHVVSTDTYYAIDIGIYSSSGGETLEALMVYVSSIVVGIFTWSVSQYFLIGFGVGVVTKFAAKKLWDNIISGKETIKEEEELSKRERIVERCNNKLSILKSDRVSSKTAILADISAFFAGAYYDDDEEY